MVGVRKQPSVKTLGYCQNPAASSWPTTSGLEPLGKRRKEFGEAESLPRPSERARTSQRVTEISPVLADAIGLRRGNVPQNKFLLRSRSGRGEGQGEVRAKPPSP